MSRRNAKFATIHDLQGHMSDCTLTKRDLEFIVRGLREMDKSNFTNRDVSDHDKLVKYLARLTYYKWQ
jgi:hypothetical protein